MAREVVVSVPLPVEQATALLMQAAEALQHRIVRFDAELRRGEIRADFHLSTLATFRIQADATAEGAESTTIRLHVSPSFKLTPWTGVGASERVGWQLVGKMQEILEPERYHRLEDADRPASPGSGRRELP